jgi:hypothetical protein
LTVKNNKDLEALAIEMEAFEELVSLVLMLPMPKQQ